MVNCDIHMYMMYDLQSILYEVVYEIHVNYGVVIFFLFSGGGGIA